MKKVNDILFRRSLDSVLPIILAFTITSCTSYNGLLKKGDNYLKKTDYPKALEAYNKAEDHNPAKVDAYNRKASLYAKRNSFDVAIMQINKAILMETDSLKKIVLGKKKTRYMYAEIQQLQKNSFTPMEYKKGLAYIDFIQQHSKDHNGKEKKLIIVKNHFSFALAQDAIEQQKFPEAVKYLDYILISTEYDEKMALKAFEGIANFYLAKKDPASALYFFNRIKHLTNFESQFAIEKIYKDFTLEALHQKDFETALIFANNLISFSNKEAHHSLKDVILETHAASEELLAKNAELLKSQQKHFNNALSLQKQLRIPEQSKINQLYYNLSRISHQQKDMLAALELLNNIPIKSTTSFFQDRIIDLKVASYLHIAETKLRSKEYFASMEYANRILVLFPTHSEANKIRAQIKGILAQASFELGKEQLNSKSFELAEYYLKNSTTYDLSYIPSSKLVLASLYEQAFLLPKALKTLEEYKTLDQFYGKDLISEDQTNYEIARLNSLKGDKETALYHLKKLYNTSNYDDYRENAFSNTDFYNLKNELAFKLWVNGKKRLKMQVLKFVDIADLDFGFGISDPRVVIQSPSFQLWSHIYKERESVLFNELYVIDDFSEHSELDLNLYDYDGDEWRGEDEFFGGRVLTPFNKEGSYYGNVYLNGNYHGTIYYEITQTMEAPGFSNLFSDDHPRFIYPIGFTETSCTQILISSGLELLKSELGYYPYLLANVAHWFLDNSVEATAERVNDVATKYLTTRYASSDMKFALKRFNQIGIIANGINDLSKSNCF